MGLLRLWPSIDPSVPRGKTHRVSSAEPFAMSKRGSDEASERALGRPDGPGLALRRDSRDALLPRRVLGPCVGTGLYDAAFSRSAAGADVRRPEGARDPGAARALASDAARHESPGHRAHRRLRRRNQRGHAHVDGGRRPDLHGDLGSGKRGGEPEPHLAGSHGPGLVAEGERLPERGPPHALPPARRLWRDLVPRRAGDAEGAPRERDHRRSVGAGAASGTVRIQRPGARTR